MSIFAVVGCLTIGTALANPTEGNHPGSNNKHAASNQYEAANSAESWHPSLLDWFSAKFGVTGCGPYSADRLGKKEKSSQNEYYTECDLEAQESVANSTRWLLLIACFQTVLGAFGTYLVWSTLSLNRKATNAALDLVRIERERNQPMLYLADAGKYGGDRITICNAGTMHCVVYEYAFKIMYEKEVDIPKDYPEALTAAVHIEPSKKENLQADVGTRTMFPDELAGAKSSGKYRWLFGYVKYVTPRGARYIYGFCGKWEIPEYGARQGRFVLTEDAKQNYQREL